MYMEYNSEKLNINIQIQKMYRKLSPLIYIYIYTQRYHVFTVFIQFVIADTNTINIISNFTEVMTIFVRATSIIIIIIIL